MSSTSFLLLHFDRLLQQNLERKLTWTIKAPRRMYERALASRIGTRNSGSIPAGQKGGGRLGVPFEEEELVAM